MISPALRHPPTILVGGNAPGAIDRAALLGSGWLTAQNATDTELTDHLRAYLSARDRHGRTPMPVLRRDIHVAESDAEARAHVEPIHTEGYRGVSMNELIVGSPSTVVDRLRGYHDLGFQHVLVRHITGDHPAMLRSFELMGDSVVPEVSAW